VLFPPAAAASPGVAPGLTDGCDGPEPPVGRLRGAVYPVPLETRRLPAFDALPRAGTICLDRLAVTERRGYPGFPGLPDRFEWFGVDLQGVFVVDTPGLYYFRLTSDDGSRLYIDGALVIDNDGYHATRAADGAVGLTAGPHAIHVPYWQGPGPVALTLEVARPGADYAVFRADHSLGDITP
jgi:hypothetical protein